MLSGQSANPASLPSDALELSIVMPCLNEAETLAVCLRKARRFLETNGVRGEVLVADNGSTDGSQAIAAKNARMVAVEKRGYGAAILGGIAAARGRFVIVGDADDSYDFANLMAFLEKLRAGADLVMGNRFSGGIAPGAMPPLHRYLGNPVLSFLGRLFFQIDIGDFHCGLRGFARDRMLALGLRTTGMEFASEMVVRSALAGYNIAEVPTTLKKAGRSRPPHLRTWSDGWRHLRFLLMFSPQWLFLYPGLFLIGFGLLSSLLIVPGTFYIGSVGIDIHTFMVGCAAIHVGFQSISFAIVARRYGIAKGFIPRSDRYGSLLDSLTLERMLVFGVSLFVLGATGVIRCISIWVSAGFGPLQYASLVRILLLSLTAISAAIQSALTAFLAGIIEIPLR